MNKVQVCYQIQKEEYDKAMAEDAYSIIPDAIQMGYSISRAKVEEIDGKYYLSYERSTSCD